MYTIDTGKIAELMMRNKICGRDLARAAGITPATASKIIRGLQRSNLKTIGKIAEVLRVDGATLIALNRAGEKKGDDLNGARYLR